MAGGFVSSAVAFDGDFTISVVFDMELNILKTGAQYSEAF